MTGAGRGIGASIAVTFARAGADVVIASRTKAQLDEVAAAVAEAGRRAVALPLDVGQDDAAEQLVAAAISEFGRLDIVVNNAGGAYPRPFLDTTPRYLDESFHFNVTTAFALYPGRGATPAGLGQRLDPQHHLGNRPAAGPRLHRVRHRQGRPGAPDQLMAADLSPRVRVNGIAPGAIATSALDIVRD